MPALVEGSVSEREGRDVGRKHLADSDHPGQTARVIFGSQLQNELHGQPSSRVPAWVCHNR